MALMIDNKPQQFVGEGEVWEALYKLSYDYIVYNHREINGREYDYTLIIPNVGLVVIEVKGWCAKYIFDVTGIDEIIIEGYDKPQSSPKKQARVYRFDWITYLKDKLNINPTVLDMVCYPFITEQEYRDKRLDIVTESEVTIFKEDLEDVKRLEKKILNLFSKNIYSYFDVLDKDRLNLIRKAQEPSFLEKVDNEKQNAPFYSIVKIIGKALSESERIELIDLYFNGVKCIVFISDKNEMQKIIQQLQNRLKEYNIVVDRNDMRFGNNDERDEIIVGTQYRIFNFELYCMPENYIGETEIVIYEGELNENRNSILKQLSEATEFNYEQYIIEHAVCDKDILVKAGAGTGKTYSMVSRIAYLCNKKQEPLSNLVDEIAMLTFTNEAADNMKARLKKLFMNYYVVTRKPQYLKYVEEVDQIQISTIHKFAKKIIQSAAMSVGLGENFRITAGEGTREELYHKHLEEYLIEKAQENKGISNELRMPVYKFEKLLLNFSNQLYNKSCDIKKVTLAEMGTFEAIPFFNDIIDKVVVKAETEYFENMIAINKIDLKQSMILLNQIISEDYKNGCMLNYKYLFIDEFQDTDDIQIDSFLKLQEIITGLKLFVVGDLKQSIYRFRGASISAFEQLQAGDNEWLEYSLSTNYRTDYRLLDRFNSLFEKIGEEGFIPFNKETDSLKSNVVTDIAKEKLIKCSSYSDEAEFYEVLFDIVEQEYNEIEKLDRNSGLSKEEKTIAILVRENWQITQLLEEAKKRDIKIETKVGGDLYQTDPALDLYKLCLALTHPMDPIYLYNLIQSNYIDIELYSEKLYGVSQSEKAKLLINAMNSQLDQNIGMNWNEIVKYAQTEPILKVLKLLYKSLKPWKKYSNNIKEQEYYKANLELVFEKIIQRYRFDYLTLNIVTNSLKISITTSQEEMTREIQEDNSGISIICTTIHKSKGLEYGTVILPFTNQKIDMLKKSEVDVVYEKKKLAYAIKLDSGERVYNSNYDSMEEVDQRIKEESRVLYVALTRTVRNLIWLKEVPTCGDITWGKLMEE